MSQLPLLHLQATSACALLVRPRWPADHVAIDPDTLNALLAVQRTLPARMRLVLTRAYEHRASGPGGVRKIMRIVGRRLFVTLYPGRRDELEDIFCTNGHDQDGTHVDVAIALDGTPLQFLPLGVFTPLAVQRRRSARHHDALATVKAALASHGFRIHRNGTESLQIHCDYLPARTSRDCA